MGDETNRSEVSSGPSGDIGVAYAPGRFDTYEDAQSSAKRHWKPLHPVETSGVAEEIARVVSDIRADRVKVPASFVKDRKHGRATFTVAMTSAQLGGPVIDATAIYNDLADRPRPVYLYEDHPSIAPPWDSAAICYVNQHGNVIVMDLTAVERPIPPDLRWRSEFEGKQFDWEQARWAVSVWVWIGGKSEGTPVPTGGPAHRWDYAIGEHGEPLDMHWVQLLPERDMAEWDMAQLVILGALNFLNCRNVEIAEPVRPRPERRRIERMGLRVHTINVFPVGKTTRSKRGERVGGVPLTSVRGHFAHYGPAYGRGLLFGKYEGKFWVPAYAKGSTEFGEDHHDYKLEPK